MNMQQLRSFVRKIESLPEERREQVRILFHNPTDACVGVFASFCEWDACTLDEIVQTAKALGIDNAEFIEDRFMEWTNSTSEEDAAFDDSCPTCGNRPGDGAGCSDPNGCGFGAAPTMLESSADAAAEWSIDARMAWEADGGR